MLRPAQRWESAAPPGQTHPYLNHLREIPSVSQLQDNVELIVFNERIQILDYVGVVQLLQREGMQEQQLQRGQGSPSTSCEPHLHSGAPTAWAHCSRQTLAETASPTDSTLEGSWAKSNSSQTGWNSLFYCKLTKHLKAMSWRMPC